MFQFVIARPVLIKIIVVRRQNMFVILFYDIGDPQYKERDNSHRIRKAVAKFIPRVQYSVYEGDLRESELKRLKDMLLAEIVPGQDSIIIYTFNSLKYSDRIVIGEDRNSPIFT